MKFITFNLVSYYKSYIILFDQLLLFNLSILKTKIKLLNILNLTISNKLKT